MDARVLCCAVLAAIVLTSGCVQDDAQEDKYHIIERESAIPQDAVKITPEMDAHPPVIHSEEYEEPVPVPGKVNTAGAEDSPFIPAGKDEMYFFFTPDVRVPPEKQILDGATGIYLSKRTGGSWGRAERVVLQDAGRLALDGCEFVRGDHMLFCSAREGYSSIHWFAAERIGGEWKNWRNADFDPSYEVGELHITADGSELYFHSPRAGGQGGLDIWVSEWQDGRWQPPENVEAVNTDGNEGWPYVTSDGGELWFTRTYMGSPAIFRSKRVTGAWQSPELIVSTFAGEPTLDSDGNLYFVHHFYRDGDMMEADIYVAMNKR